MKDHFEASHKVAAEIAHLESLHRAIPGKIAALGERLAAQLVTDGSKLVGTWLEIRDNEASGVLRYYHVTRIERSPLIPWIDAAAPNSPDNLRKDRVLVFADGLVCVAEGECMFDSSLKCEERKHIVDVYELLHSRQVSPEEVANLLSKKEGV